MSESNNLNPREHLMGSNFVRKSLLQPDKVDAGVEKMRVDFVALGGIVFRRLTIEPHFRASVHLKKSMGIDLCPFPHTLVVVSGRGVFKMKDGEEHEVEPWDVLEMDADHDFWNTGEEPFVMIEPTFEAGKT